VRNLFDKTRSRFKSAKPAVAQNSSPSSPPASTK
jgi:hypothetical protein